MRKNHENRFRDTIRSRIRYVFFLPLSFNGWTLGDFEEDLVVFFTRSGTGIMVFWSAINLGINLSDLLSCYLGFTLRINFRLSLLIVYIERFQRTSITLKHSCLLFSPLVLIHFFVFDFFYCDFLMSQGSWIANSGGKKVEAAKPDLRITVPKFDNSEIIAS